jgi:hypothetical protein
MKLGGGGMIGGNGTARERENNRSKPKERVTDIGREETRRYSMKEEWQRSRKYVSRMELGVKKNKRIVRKQQT